MKFKLLQKTFDAAGKTLFGKGKPLSFFYPFFDAANTFFFTPNEKTSGTVHIRDCNDFKRVMFAVICALIPCALTGVYNVGLQANRTIAAVGTDAIPDGWRGAILRCVADACPALGIFDASSVCGCFAYGLVFFLPIYVVAMIVGIAWETIFAKIYGHEINEGFFVTGLMFALIVPPTIPLWQVVLAISFGVVLGKEIFGGTGRNFMNPALIARAFLFFGYAGQISGDKVWVAVDGVSKATPLSLASQGVDAIREAGYSFFDAFVGTIPGAIGETSTLACLFGAAFLLVVGVASWRTMISTFAGGAVVASIFALLGPEASASYPAFSLGPGWHFALGGFAFGAIFMATDPVTSAATKIGQYLYGALIGALIVVVRVFNPAYPEGVMLAILFGNCVAPLIDYAVVSANVRRRVKRLERARESAENRIESR